MDKLEDEDMDNFGLVDSVAVATIGHTILIIDR